jgi:parvulin-like peptidyl-prolyl isomerase
LPNVSDYVGSVTYQPNQVYSFAVRGRFDQSTFTPQRLEVETRANFERWTLQFLYGDYAPQPLLGFLTRREGFLTGASVKLTANWILLGSTRYDIENDRSNGGASADTLKHRLKAQIAWTTLVRGRFKVSLEIADKDVEAELQLHQPQEKDQVGYEYVVRPIVLIVPRGAPDAAYEARKRDADALRGRFATCTDGIPFARGLPEVAVRDPINKSSADLPPALRTILDNVEIGHLTPPEQTAEGIQMFAVCSKKESKSDAPGLKEVRDKMFEKKFGAKANRYLADLRRQAMIEYK